MEEFLENDLRFYGSVGNTFCCSSMASFKVATEKV